VNDFFRVGDIIDVEVLGIDPNTQKLKLSYKAIKRQSINRYFSIGFSSLEEKIPEWIEQKLKEIKKDG
jgi:predicted RNA-binding protein with RPS1 domain